MARYILGRAVALLALTVPAALAAQMPQQTLPPKMDPQPTQGAITVEDLMTRLYQFADDSMGGRATGTVYHEKATAYLAREAERLGLQPAGDNGSYFQDLPMVRRGYEPGSSVMVASRRFVLGEHFVPMVARGATPRLATAAEVVVGGVHGDSSTWISAEAARGKLVVFRPNARQLQLNMRFLAITADSRFADAAGVVVPAWDQLAPNFRARMAQPSMAMLSGDESSEQLPPALIASSEMVEALLAAAGQRVGMNIRYTESKAPARNVVAVLPGRDPALRGQYVALGAHSDHDPLESRGLDHDSLRAVNFARNQLTIANNGQRPGAAETARLSVNLDSLRAQRPTRRDSIKNGADDDGSGSVVLLELAEAFATAAEKPRRSLLFVWHAAEELGLLGANHWTENPTVPLDSVVAQLNMDMVGRGMEGDIAGGGPQYLQLVGSRRLSRELGDLVEDVNARREHRFRFDYSFDADGHPERIYCRSDHAMYARYGIPVTFFHTGLHHDYHQVTDEPQYIDYRKMFNVAGLIYDVARELGNRDARPKLDGPKPDPRAACRQ